MTNIPKSGTIVPTMGNAQPVSISDVLFSGGQRRVLGLLFGQPDKSFYANEIARIGMTGRGALQRKWLKPGMSQFFSWTAGMVPSSLTLVTW